MSPLSQIRLWGRHEKNLFVQGENELRGIAEGHCELRLAQDIHHLTANC